MSATSTTSSGTLQFNKEVKFGDYQIQFSQTYNGIWKVNLVLPAPHPGLAARGGTLQVRGEWDSVNGQWFGSTGVGWSISKSTPLQPSGGWSFFGGVSTGGTFRWQNGQFELSSDGNVYAQLTVTTSQPLPNNPNRIQGSHTVRIRLGSFEDVEAHLPPGMTRDEMARLPDSLENPYPSQQMPDVIIETPRNPPLRIRGSVAPDGEVLLEPGAAEQLKAAMEDYSDMGIIPRCFLAGTPILMADGQEKPIEDIRVGDMVMSFDPSADQGRGALVPKPVSRTFQNITRSIIDLRGLHMTPGHVCLTDDGRFETIAEILLRDGILVEADGTRIRARTGAKIGSMEDTPVLIAYPDEKTGKEILVRARAGIPCLLVRERDGTMRHLSLALMLRTYHQTLTPDGLILSPDGSFGDATDWPEDSTPMDADYRRNWVIQTADGKPYVPEWILEVASEAREEQTVGATLRRITSPPSQRFTPKVVDNPTPPARNRAERRAQKHRGPL